MDESANSNVFPAPGHRAHSAGLWSESEAQDRASFMKACRQGDIEQVKAALDAGIDTHLWDTNKRGPLHIASIQGHTAVVEALVAAGADLEALDTMQETPFASAARMQHIPVMRLLADAGADVNAYDGSDTPLTLAARSNRPDIVNALLELGADLGARDRNGQTALDNAEAMSCHPVTACIDAFLRRQSVDADVAAQDPTLSSSL